MAIVGTDEEEDGIMGNPMPTTSMSKNGVAAQAAAVQPYSGAGGFVSGGTGSGAGQGATTSSSPAGTPSPASGGGGYTNLSSYLQANAGQGNMLGGALQGASNVLSNASKAYGDAASTEIDAGSKNLGVSSDVMGKISSGTPTFNSNILPEVASSGVVPASAYYTGPELEQARVDYSGPRNGQYSGATQALGARAAEANAGLSSSLDTLGKPGGVQGLLKSTYSRPGYTAGENTLDAFLTQGTPEGRQGLADAQSAGAAARSSYSGLGAMLGNKVNAADTQAQSTDKTYQDAINAAKASANDLLGRYQRTAQGGIKTIDSMTDTGGGNAFPVTTPNTVSSPKVSVPMPHTNPIIPNPTDYIKNQPGTGNDNVNNDLYPAVKSFVNTAGSAIAPVVNPVADDAKKTVGRAFSKVKSMITGRP